MTNPTPAEITAALAVLRRIPNTNPSISLAAIERLNHPLRRMAADVLTYVSGCVPDTVEDMERDLLAAAERHGLRITTAPEPGEVVGHVIGRARPGGAWFIPEHDTAWNADDSDGARKSASHPRDCAFALVLLPEGGKA